MFSFRQLPVQQITIISLKGRHFRYSVITHSEHRDHITQYNNEANPYWKTKGNHATTLLPLAAFQLVTVTNSKCSQWLQCSHQDYLTISINTQNVKQFPWRPHIKEQSTYIKTFTHALTWKCCHVNGIFIIRSIRCSHLDNFQCSKLQ